MKNRDVARVLDEMGQMLEIQGANAFKVNAYYKAARAIGDLKEDIEAIADGESLTSIPGIGSGISEKIREFLETGSIRQHLELAEQIGPGLREMLAIPGMGPRTVSLIHRKLGIDTLDALEKAAREGRLRSLPGMGPKKEEGILRGLDLLSRSRGRARLGDVLPRVESIVRDLEATGLGRKFVAAGSVRRRCETVGDIDILATSRRPAELVQAFTGMPWVGRVLAAGDTKGSVLIEGPIQVDLRAVPVASYGAALLYFTGSKAHNIRVREIARSRGLKVNEYGIYRGEKAIGGKTEEEVYRLLELPWIPPELREDRGEIEAALKGEVPSLVEEGDLKGDLHVHTASSDGRAGINDLVAEARRLGHRYMAITDHSQSLRVAGGLAAKALESQIAEIRRANERLRGFRVLAGAEVEILADGRLDYPDALLEKLDLVVAALHTVGRSQSAESVTARVVRALEHPAVRILAHPSGRLIGSREPYPVNIDQVLQAAADRGVAIEINSQPDRLDLDDLGCRRARELGVKLVISSDAHSPEQIRFLGLGVSVARRGWLAKTDILNTLPVNRLLRALRKG